MKLEQFQPDDQILLRILADALDKLLRLVHRGVGMIVERGILHHLPERALALIDAAQNRVEPRHRVVELLGEGRVLGHLAERALTGVD